MRGRVGRMGWSHIYVWWIKIQEGYLRSEENPGPHQDPNPGFQDREDKSSQLLATKTKRIESVEETSGAPSSSS